MKRLAVLMMIPALAMFMVPALASANWYYWWGIQGTWEMSASGSCLHSSDPYYQDPARNNWWTAPVGSQVYAGVTVSNGTWIFKANGEGTYSQTIYATILPGGATSMPGPAGSPLPVPLEVRVIAQKDQLFTYAITPSGDITVTTGGIELIGNISKDMNTMTLLSANNVQKFGGNFQYTICNTARTLIKVQEMYYPTGLR
jgi:hypothetical protein